MNHPLTLRLPAHQPSTRKRSRSSLEIFDLSLPYDTKRARIGIQELTTTNQPISLPPTSRPSSSSGPETRSSSDCSSSGLDSEETSSSDDESSDGRGIDEGYDSDSESGSTTTSSSSSSSEADSGDEDRSSPRSATIAMNSAGGSRGVLASLGASSPVSLAAKLSAFLPRMAAANAELDSARENGLLGERNIEEVDDEGRYIEMDLGLGVLEERQDDRSSGSDNDGDESEAGSTRSKSSSRSRRNDTMTVLMGRKGVRKPDIQVMET